MLKAKNRFFISILEIEEPNLCLEGHLTGALQESCIVYAKDQKGTRYEGEIFHLPNRDRYDENGNKTTKGTGFRMKLPLKAGRKYTFWVKVNEKKEKKLTPSFGRFSKLTKKTDACYYTKGKYLLKPLGEGIAIKNNSRKIRWKAEWKLLKFLAREKEFQLVMIRVVTKLMKRFQKNKVWILCDRSYLAGDNGEALFRHIQGVKPVGVKAYFMLDAKSRDYNRMKKTGPVLKKDSFYYKCKFLCADKIISSHADAWVINAFEDKMDYVRDLCDFSFVFLQHGIAMNDMSVWLHRHSKNIKMLVSSAKPEYDAFLSYPYEYGPDVIKLTGLPRYDNLINEAEKKIVFLPTWRKRLAGPVVQGSSEHVYSESFKDSAYFRFYNQLIGDPDLLQCMKEHGYTGEFYVHPAFDVQSRDFVGNDTIQVITETADYNAVFRENALLVTDYSSVAFDFAYMKKPVVYTQFDKDTFFEGHAFVEGYFDFEKDGFGPVCMDYKSAVETLILYIKGQCEMAEIYKKRVDKFFAHNDRDNCTRVLDAIMNI